MNKIAQIQYQLIDIKIKERTTIVRVLNTETGEVFIGNAVCSPDDDMDYNVGINIATRRAVKQLFNEAMDRAIDNLGDFGLSCEGATYIEC